MTMTGLDESKITLKAGNGMLTFKNFILPHFILFLKTAKIWQMHVFNPGKYTGMAMYISVKFLPRYYENSAAVARCVCVGGRNLTCTELCAELVPKMWKQVPNRFGTVTRNIKFPPYPSSVGFFCDGTWVRELVPLKNNLPCFISLSPIHDWLP